ncbi:hypothetical protein CDAR_57951 [Caerostris darwini]|uniref:Uncharacterized protein n=1 Tax=Caerostris darwini TaxID=1538125 RepID=A0AAV4U6X8_9ARAC|nr:hypothetical protein CDAR_57951 [Caerostris darwini]
MALKPIFQNPKSSSSVPEAHLPAVEEVSNQPMAFSPRCPRSRCTRTTGFSLSFSFCFIGGPFKQLYSSRFVDCVSIRDQIQSETTVPATIPQEEQDPLNKTLYVLKEFVAIFNSLGGVGKVYNRLLQCKNPIEKLRLFTGLFDQQGN